MNKLLLFLIFIFGATSLIAQNVVIDGVTFSADKKTLIKYPVDKVGEEYVVPEGTEIIAERAFEGSSLRSIIFPLSLNEIGNYAFVGSDLSSIIWKHFPDFIGRQVFVVSNVEKFETHVDSDNCVSIDGVLFSKDHKVLLRFPNKKNRFEEAYEVPEGTEVIFARAFENSEIYERITLPSTLKEIGENAFQIFERSITKQFDTSSYCWISNVDCHALIPPAIVDDPFIKHYNVNLSVPIESFDIYRNTPYWKGFRSINGSTGIVKNQEDFSKSKSKVYIKNDVLHLESENMLEMIEIYNTNGSCIWSECIGSKCWQLETFKLPVGLLMIKILTEDDKIETFKLLNQNAI